MYWLKTAVIYLTYSVGFGNLGRPWLGSPIHLHWAHFCVSGQLLGILRAGSSRMVSAGRARFSSRCLLTYSRLVWPCSHDSNKAGCIRIIPYFLIHYLVGQVTGQPRFKKWENRPFQILALKQGLFDNRIVCPIIFYIHNRLCLYS